MVWVPHHSDLKLQNVASGRASPEVKGLGSSSSSLTFRYVTLEKLLIFSITLISYCKWDFVYHVILRGNSINLHKLLGDY